MNEFRLKLGDEAKDKITGFQGIIVARSHWLHNCDVYLLKSQELKEGKPLDNEAFDDDQVVILKEGAVACAEKDPDFHFNLGDKVEDDLTSYKGTVIAQTQWFSNCNHYAIQAEGITKEGKTLKREHVPEGQVILIKAVNPIKKEKTEKKFPGGPVDKVFVTNR